MSKKITMIDSGAFSVWKSKNRVEIDVRDYGDYLLRQRHHFDACANLDVIPGTPNHPPSPEEAEAAVEESWENLQYLESLGLNPIPVYHQGEHPDALKRIIDAVYDYVGISPNDKSPKPQRERFLNETFFSSPTARDGPSSRRMALASRPWTSCSAIRGIRLTAPHGRRRHDTAPYSFLAKASIVIFGTTPAHRLSWSSRRNQPSSTVAKASTS